MEDATSAPAGFADWEGRWRHTDALLERAGVYTNAAFQPGKHVAEFVHSGAKILVIGAGGLGCELLKNLALSGFRDIHVIDMDTIDVSNLNRQFLFRSGDVGKPKAIVAAEFIMKRVPGVVVTPYFGRIQDKDPDYYRQFHVIVCGLDSIDARRWINSLLVSLVERDENGEWDLSSMVPMVDGGTEGLKGQVRVVLPRVSTCFECALDAFPPAASYPMCTIANTPRLPEHCIEWASVLEWPRVFPDTKLDKDDPAHLTWLFETASKRAKEFSIQGVTYRLTQGVVKNIIPAIASTNAIVAAASTNEVFKLVTSVAAYLDNYMQYTGTRGIHTYTFQYDRKADCAVCGTEVEIFRTEPTLLLQNLIDYLGENTKYRLKKPSIRSSSGKSLYMQSPPTLEEATRPNLQLPLSQLVANDDVLSITDPAFALPVMLQIRYSSAAASE